MVSGEKTVSANAGSLRAPSLAVHISVIRKTMNFDKLRIIIYGARFSRIAPSWYTWIFATCDIASIVIQS